MVNLVVALPAEAKPLVANFLLKPVSSVSVPFPKVPGLAYSGLNKTRHFWKWYRPCVYRNGGIRLIVSGVGKERAAEAVSFLHNLSHHESDQAWINVGIAGHRDHAIGTGILAHKITDSKSKKSWYPAFVFHPPAMTDSILTVGSAESRYESPSVYDMEASGFYEAALRYSTVELIHSYKVISDNSKSSHRKVTPRLAEQMIGNRLSEISSLVSELQKLADQLRSLEISAEELEPFLIRWHFTVTEQFQLERLLRRLKTLAPDFVFQNEFSKLSNSDQVLSRLRELVNQIPVPL